MSKQPGGQLSSAQSSLLRATLKLSLMEQQRRLEGRLCWLLPKLEAWKLLVRLINISSEKILEWSGSVVVVSTKMLRKGRVFLTCGCVFVFVAM
ncbi:hypothetical protein LINPERPRIM_LOCUS12117 [Linum perenne]